MMKDVLQLPGMISGHGNPHEAITTTLGFCNRFPSGSIVIYIYTNKYECMYTHINMNVYI